MRQAAESTAHVPRATVGMALINVALQTSASDSQGSPPAPPQSPQAMLFNDPSLHHCKSLALASICSLAQIMPFTCLGERYRCVYLHVCRKPAVQRQNRAAEFLCFSLC